MADGKTTNRLAEETSPYLTMHAKDPVDWYPWGLEAFDLARAEDKPIFLSIGYASCHWCHVMQRESFRDQATADILNERFISVKVDREERPDVDAVYMEYVTATTGSGGWPMTVFLTPALLPVFGGTYFPKRSPQHSATAPPAFTDVLADVHEAWRHDRDRTEDAASSARDFLEEAFAPKRPLPLSAELVNRAAEAILSAEDDLHGGFGRAPKFPQAPVVGFLLRHARISGDARTRDAGVRALRAMLRGGIYDQAGGGIARYATDAAWLVPHFEKMLYDNALLLTNLGDAYALHADEEFAFAARQTADFLDRDMPAPGGGFVSALSAETRGVEGATYTWLHEDLQQILSPEELALAKRWLGVNERGNWEGLNILTRSGGRETQAEEVDAVLARLLAARAQRPQPERDTKVLTSWNAMAATGLLHAGMAIDDGSMIADGLALVRMLVSRADTSGGEGSAELVHVLDDPSVAHIRLAEDYAHLAAACVAAYAADGGAEHFDAAEWLFASAMEKFLAGGVIHAVPDETELPVRPLDERDSPIPSASSTLAQVALRLLSLTERDEYRSLAEGILSRTALLASEAPPFGATALTAMLDLLTEE